MEINNFAQYEGESFSKVQKRYKELMRRCPQHGLPKWMQVQNFYSGLTATIGTLIDALAGVTFTKKTKDFSL